MLHQRLPGEHLSRLGGQIADEIVLPLSELQGVAVLIDGGLLLVHHHPAQLQSLARGRLSLLSLGGSHSGAADVGLDPGQQFPHAEGLCDIVVCPQLQAQHLVGLLLPGGEHQDGHRTASLPDAAAHLKAVHPRQHQIQQHQVGVLLQGQLQAGVAVVGLQGVVSLPLQVKGQDVHDILLVLYNEHGLSHSAAPSQRPSRTLVLSTVATVLASSTVPSITCSSSCWKGMVITFKNSSSSGWLSFLRRSRARYM